LKTPEVYKQAKTPSMGKTASSNRKRAPASEHMDARIGKDGFSRRNTLTVREIVVGFCHKVN